MTESPSKPLGDLSNLTPSPPKRAHVGGDGVDHKKSARQNGPDEIEVSDEIKQPEPKENGKALVPSQRPPASQTMVPFPRE